MARTVARRGRTDAVALPEWIAPQLSQLVDAAPEGDCWLHEIKFDGYRMHARLDRGTVNLLTRTGLDWTQKYPPIAAAVSALSARQAYLDGELCGVFPDGITSPTKRKTTTSAATDSDHSNPAVPGPMPAAGGGYEWSEN
jgi:ATP-dependent DNA ligase